MTNRGVPDHRPPVEEWFSSRGFTVVLSEEDGVFWAALRSATGRIVAPRYARGGTLIEAAERAKARYLEEQ